MRFHPISELFAEPYEPPMRSMRFFHPMMRPRRLSRVDLPTFRAHCSSLMDGLRIDPHATHGGPHAAILK
jgi:hypothetical protein